MGQLLDMTGWVMKEHGISDSRLTVLYQDKERSGHNSYWYCQCECGTIKSIQGGKIRSGIIKSCGCYNKEFPRGKEIIEQNIIPIGTKIGKLTVIEDLGFISSPYRQGNAHASLCQCDCGSQPIIVFNSWLRAKTKLSCGCLNSKGEAYIRQLLLSANLPFIAQYTFNDLIGKQNNKFRFDFAVFNENNELQFLIEYDGEQHFQPSRGNRLKQTLDEIQERDKIKNNYCKQHNIRLKRIPYTEKMNFTIDDILSNKYNIE